MLFCSSDFYIAFELWVTSSPTSSPHFLDPKKSVFWFLVWIMLVKQQCFISFSFFSPFSHSKPYWLLNYAHRLQLNEPISTVPTIGFNVETVCILDQFSFEMMVHHSLLSSHELLFIQFFFLDPIQESDFPSVGFRWSD